MIVATCKIHGELTIHASTKAGWQRNGKRRYRCTICKNRITRKSATKVRKEQRVIKKAPRKHLFKRDNNASMYYMGRCMCLCHWLKKKESALQCDCKLTYGDMHECGAIV